MASPTTTYPTIRAQWVSVLEALTPNALASDTFERAENVSTLREWAEENPAACLRQFEITRVGTRESPPVTNGTSERITEEAELVIAYPRQWNTYRRSADDVAGVHSFEDILDADSEQITASIGVHGISNYVSGQSLCLASYRIEDGEEVAFLVVDLKVTYRRSTGETDHTTMQNDGMQRFAHTTTIESDEHPVTFPLTMADATYNVEPPTVEDSGYEGVICRLKPGSRTRYGFTVACSKTVPIGLTIAITVGDRSGDR